MAFYLRFLLLFSTVFSPTTATPNRSLNPPLKFPRDSVNNTNITFSAPFTYQNLYSLQTRFWTSFLYPSSQQQALSINSSLLSPDIQGRIDLSRTFDGSELNTEYLFGLFANIASSPLSLSLIGYPVSFQITGFTATGNISAASTIVYFNVTSLGLVVPCEVDTWILWNQYGKIEQYEATFRRFQWMMDYMIEAAAPKLGSNSTTQTVSILTAGLAQSICATASLYCNGTNVQYPDTPTCYDFLTTQIRFGEAYELGRNTLLCRMVHQNMVPFRPDVHCPHIGPTGGGYCDDSATYGEVVEQVYFRESFVAAIPGS